MIRRKFLFLDIDGVLNKHGDMPMLCSAIDNLRLIIEQTNCEVILSSSLGVFAEWRKDMINVGKFPEDLLKHFKGSAYFDFHPICFDELLKQEGFIQSQKRGECIKITLSTILSPTEIANNVKKNFVIIDDCIGDIKPNQLPFLVKTDPSKGLTKENALEAISLLNQNVDLTKQEKLERAINNLKIGF